MPRRSTPQAGGKSFAELFPQLFLFPLLIVTVCVLVWLLFIASAQDNRSVEQLLSDLRSGGAHGRRQDAYALALKAREQAEVGKYFTASETEQLLALMAAERRDADDPEFLEFLVMAAGRAGQPDLTVPVMQDLALAGNAPEPARMWAVRALGLSGSPAAVPALAAVHAQSTGSNAWEFRWNALAGLTNLKDPVVIPLLERALSDARRELRWSAACWLANTFGRGEGADVLESLVDWDFLDRQRGDQGRDLTHEQKEKYMLMALEGLTRLRGEAVRPLLREKTDDGRSVQVRNRAFELLEELDAAAKTSGADGAPATSQRSPALARLDRV